MFKIHLKKGVTIILLLIGTIALNAQNFIYNPGFESGDFAKADKSVTSTTKITTDYLDIWKRANEDCFHSPDWFRKGAPSNNFAMQNVSDKDDSYESSPGATFPFSYSKIFPHGGYGMLGLYRYELIQQKYDKSGLVNKLNSTAWKTITLRFWIRQTNKSGPKDRSDLNIYLARNKVEYKINNPDGRTLKDPHGRKIGVSCDYDFYNDKYTEYTIGNGLEKVATITANDFLTRYTEGKWHYVEKVFNAPQNINVLDWIVFDLSPKSGSKHPYNPGGYLFIDDIEMVVGCEDKCSRTDGAIGNVVLGNTIDKTNSFTMALPGSLPLSNIKSLRLEVFTSAGASTTLFDKTISCVNGLDHIIYWDGKNNLGSPLANSIYHYRITVKNDCGNQEFTGSILKLDDYMGSNVTNFNELCKNGINVTPEPCCYPDIYHANQNFKGPDPGWSEFVVGRNIWACIAKPDFSDEVLVEKDAKVLYKAGNMILLKEGFNTENGAVFCAEIESCGRTVPRIRTRISGTDNSEEIPENAPLLEEKDLNALKFNVYPNPSNTGQFKLDVLNNSINSYVEVLNLMGNIVHKAKISSDRTTIDIGNQSKGIYLVRIIDGDRILTKKVVYN